MWTSPGRTLLVIAVLLAGCRSALLDGASGDGSVSVCGRDGGAASPGGSVACGSASCPAPSVCCTRDFGHQGTCLPATDCPATDRFACDDDGDCLPGSQCCYSPFGGARCVLGGQCPCYSAWLSLCGSDADCESGQHCCVRFTGRDPAGYRLCTAAACP